MDTTVAIASGIAVALATAYFNSVRLYGSGIGVDDLLAAMSDKGLVDIKRGRTGGVYYPDK